MSRYRKVDPRIWNDEKFRALTDMGKLVFFMLLTHPAMTALGAMRATIAGLAEELGWTSDAFREAFEDVLQQDMAEHDSKACLIALPNFVRYNLPESPNVIKAWVGALDMLPECDLKTTVVHRAKGVAEGMTKGFADAFRDAFAQAMPYQEPEQKQKLKNTVAGATTGVEFNAFWQAWPQHQRKVAKSQCAAKWEAKGCEPIADAVLAGLECAKRSEDWTKDGGKFIPAPLVWLNQSRWEAFAGADATTPPPASDSAYQEHMERLAEDRQREATATPDALAQLAATRARIKEAQLGLKPIPETHLFEESDT